MIDILLWNVSLPVAFFHRMCGCGTPSAWQLILAGRPEMAVISLGSKTHRGGTIKNIKVLINHMQDNVYEIYSVYFWFLHF